MLLPPAIRALALFLLYFGGVRVGLLFFEEQISILWPANGIALAFFVVYAPREWLSLSVAMSAGYFLALVDLAAQPLPIKIGFLVANFIEILPAAFLIRRKLESGAKLDSLGGTLSFLGLGVVAGPLLGSLAATLVAQAGFDQDFSIRVWLGWGVGNAISTLAIFPPTYWLLSVAPGSGQIKNAITNSKFVFEASLLFLVSLLSLLLIFNRDFSFSFIYGSIHIIFIFMAWASLRFSMRVVSAWLLLVVFFAAGFTLNDQGPFALNGEDFRDAIFSLHMFSISLCVTSLLLVSVMADKSRIEDSLRVANDAKSSFLAAMSHELRTPLNAIIGFSEIIGQLPSRSEDDDRIREYGKDINHAGLHLLALINDILDLSKVEAGKEQLQEAVLDIRSLVDDAAGMVSDLASRKRIALDLHVAEDGSRLLADERKLRQMLINLLSNAVKFTEEGGRVTVRAGYSGEPGYEIQVIDEGIGIAPENIPRALSKFEQIDSGIARRHEGTGLGLPLTKALVELHGGSIELRSTLGNGTTVTLRFPADRVRHARIAAPPRQFGLEGKV